MSNISKAFQNKDAFIGYLTAGAASAQDFLNLEKIGVKVLEVGIPFSDPVADGPVIQKAMQKALDIGTTPDKVFSIVHEIREKSEIPIVLFVIRPLAWLLFAVIPFPGVVLNHVPTRILNFLRCRRCSVRSLPGRAPSGLGPK